MPMQRYLLYLIVFLHIVFCVNTFGQTVPSMVRFDSPSYILVNTNFDASVIFRIDEILTETLSLTFEKQEFVKISSAILKYENNSTEIKIRERKNNPNIITLNINVNDLEFSKNLPHQIILKCSASEPIKLSSDLFSFLQSDIQENIIIEEDFLTDAEIIKTQIYKIQQTAGKSAEFINGSNLNIRISKNNEWENIFIEYWIKSKDELINFFNVVETLNNDTLISFSKNNFGFISFPICDNEIARNDVYIGNDSWNYIAVKISNDLNQIKTDVYVNSELLSKFDW